MSEHITNDEVVAPVDETIVESAGEQPTEPVDPLVAERDAALAQRDEYKDIALRLQADFENYRKRAATQTADEIDRATGKIAEALLPVLDACEAAFSHGVDGVEPIWSALIGALQKQGLEALDLQGKPFDPACAEAVMHEPADGESNGETVVVEVLRTGYMWKGRVLRAAMVKVKG
ncbi:MAG: nucleotide exchange factor GrpE [Acidobacteria bacterium]|jgi:molecular chaperone GrpE|nr:nucleotide exchange factor GrpE [Acidobacteriota bacterium]